MLSLRLASGSASPTAPRGMPRASSSATLDAMAAMSDVSSQQGAAVSSSSGSLRSASWGSAPDADDVDLSSQSSRTKALAIPYTRAARARLDAAERQGQAFDEQLELLAAVKAFFADQQKAPHMAAQQI